MPKPRTPKCRECDDTGVIETGNNDLPCDCQAGRTATFNVAGVDGRVSGEELQRHFFNGCLEPIGWPWRDSKPAASLPERWRGINLDVLQGNAERLLALLKDRQPGLVSWNDLLRGYLAELHEQIVDARKYDPSWVLSRVGNFTIK